MKIEVGDIVCSRRRDLGLVVYILGSGFVEVVWSGNGKILKQLRHTGTINVLISRTSF